MRHSGIGEMSPKRGLITSEDRRVHHENWEKKLEKLTCVISLIIHVRIKVDKKGHDMNHVCECNAKKIRTSARHSK